MFKIIQKNRQHLSCLILIGLISCGKANKANDSEIIASDNNNAIIHGRFVDLLNSTGIENAVVKATVSIAKENTGENVDENTDENWQDKTNQDGVFDIQLPGNETYSLSITHPSGNPIYFYKNILTNIEKTTFLETVAHIESNQSINNAVISGRIANAENDQIITGVSISLREDINNQNAPVISEQTTDDTGTFSFDNLKPGNYSAHIISSDYFEDRKTLIANTNSTISNNNFQLLKKIDGINYTIILEWTNTALDLDAHLTGLQLESDERFHVYYDNPGNVTEAPFSAFRKSDEDNELIQIGKQTEGVYRYSVHDFSNLFSFSTTQLSNSNARVKLYNNKVLLDVFYVPANINGNVWTVFEINETNISTINSMTHQNSSAAIK